MLFEVYAVMLKRASVNTIDLYLTTLIIIIIIFCVNVFCVRKRRLIRFWHVDRMDVDNWVKKCSDVDVEGSHFRGR